MKILIVEDDREIAQLVRATLERESFDCEVAGDGWQGLRLFAEFNPDLIVLDLMLPHLDGLEVCTRLRQAASAKDPYILMLTAKGEELDRIIGLSTGADDYLVKPFSPRELVARVRALLRRRLRQGGEEGTPACQTRHFRLDLDQHVALRILEEQTPEILELTSLEFNLLATLMTSVGRVWSRSQLIDRLWGQDFFGDERVVDTHIRRLRKKVEPDPANPTFIKTVIGLGYKFDDQTF
jgi:two-component system OmpR family response regulator